MRVAEALRGNVASLRDAAKRSSIGLVLSIAIALRRERRPENFLVILRRRLFFSIELFFAIRLSLPFPRLSWPNAHSLPERKIERGQQRARFLVGARRGADRDVHAPDFGCLVVVDLREDDVFLDAERVVAAPVEALR